MNRQIEKPLVSEIATAPAIHGRGAAENPPNRFERLAFAPELDDILAEEQVSPHTQFFHDATEFGNWMPGELSKSDELLHRASLRGSNCHGENAMRFLAEIKVRIYTVYLKNKASFRTVILI